MLKINTGFRIFFLFQSLWTRA